MLNCKIVNKFYFEGKFQNFKFFAANPLRPDINPEAEFAYGSGQINPSKAAYPSLVYDTVEADYINLLCGQGYSTRLLQIVTGNRKSSCPKSGSAQLASYLINYPALICSLCLAFGTNQPCFQ